MLAQQIFRQSRGRKRSGVARRPISRASRKLAAPGNGSTPGNDARAANNPARHRPTSARVRTRYSSSSGDDDMTATPAAISSAPTDHGGSCARNASAHSGGRIM